MARPRTSQLTEAHRRIAQAIAAIERSTGFSATVGELVERLGLATPSSLRPTLQIMQRNGYVAMQGGLVRLTPKGRYEIQAGGLPVLGSIQAGALTAAIAEPEEILEEVLPHQPGDFLLRVRGDSMVGDGILPGDLVLLRPGVDPAQGEIAAVQVGGEEGEYAGGDYEATLKRVYREGSRVRLKAANPAYPDRVVPGEAVQVVGVFRGLVRLSNRS